MELYRESMAVASNNSVRPLTVTFSEKRLPPRKTSTSQNANDPKNCDEAWVTLKLEGRP